ncbi:hypothetical protein OFO01_00860 [Campylobacter sp. JMF_01 NE2]|uniref:hypothetical protein n=1 Tax=unclassified Campylobacter TaxID=2593542 RepID=UPI0022E9F9DB|nr:MULTISPECIES: hypothetical protein [unclassified Campylobacter]MDA3052006.1 hypothetical protein [Campylobacter sp. JMF_03 NE3]MDA3054619.1 hypothetical protein [Campylobacter sp. VBCF_07 NA4]MDA3066340.1 hypothetical protein [Campylobacter sp. JMF_01 NE2]MDA3070137.1 hypothetical protein [Campylobacter sp. VBCF_08 NA3]WBR54571.1 hypothetical protein PF027_01510 [Campylobacter sp. VBCF_01 NA2]
MSKGGAGGSGLGSLILIIVVIFFGVKVVWPKFTSLTDGPLAASAVTDLDRFFKDIKSDYDAKGEFRELKNMTSVRQFSDEDLNAKVVVGKPIKYGVGVKSKGNMEMCADITLKHDGNLYFMELYPINKKSNLCKTFHNLETFKKYSRFNVGRG